MSVATHQGPEVVNMAIMFSARGGRTSTTDQRQRLLPRRTSIYIPRLMNCLRENERQGDPHLAAPAGNDDFPKV